MKTFTYKTLSYSSPILDTELRSLGRQGWEMCGMAYVLNNTEQPYLYYFKREI